MHPAIRLVMLLILAAMLPGLSLAVLTVIALGMACAHVIHGGLAGVRQVGFGVWRLRWLFLAILFLYVGLTQGEPVTDALPGLSREGLVEGSRRALVLINLVAAVYLLALMTPLTDLVSGLLWLLLPLRWLRLDPRRLALRIGLVLEQVLAPGGSPAAGALSGGARSVLETAARRIEGIEAGAMQGTSQRPALRPSRAPAAWEWLYPLALAAGLYGVPW